MTHWFYSWGFEGTNAFKSPPKQLWRWQLSPSSPTVGSQSMTAASGQFIMSIKKETRACCTGSEKHRNEGKMKNAVVQIKT